MKEVCNIINISKVFTSSYHPQCEGFIERTNGKITQIIVMFVSSNKKDSDTYLKSTVYAYNTSMSETTGNTLFFLTCGCEPIKLPDISFLPPSSLSRCVNHYREKIINEVRIARTHATGHKSQQKMKEYYGQQADPAEAN